MDRNELQHFKELLLKERDKRIESVRDDKQGRGLSLRDATSELSSYDNHPGDLGNETFEAEKNFSFRTRDKFLESEIEVALNKIEEGNFGICEVCHREIKHDRLEVRPYSRLCANCENDYEQKIDNEEKGRPIEEQVTFPPFGRSFTENSVEDKVEFDGEDTWQAVNVYNDVTSDNPFSKDDSMGYVEDVERISNSRYKKQLE